MKVKVLYFAALRDETGLREQEIEVDEGATVGSVWERLGTQFPVLSRFAMPLTAVNETYEGAAHRLNDGDELALIPPVAGG